VSKILIVSGRILVIVISILFIMSFTNIRKDFLSTKSYKIPEIKDTIIHDTLPYPFDDYENNPFALNRQLPLFLNQPSAIKSEVKYDAVTGKFVFYDKIGNFNYRNPYYMSFNEFLIYSNKKNIHEYWMERSAMESTKGEGSFVDHLVNQNLIVPIQGFDKIFGTNTINIKPQGTAEIIFGLKITEIENEALPKDLQKMVNFDFDMNIKMGVSGQIGDKMKLGINFDTDATFEFENNVKIAYQGKEDEIIQKIEAGNVNMPLSGSLITGSHSLFGLKTELKFGNLLVTSVFSQQKGESKTIEFAGGASTTPFEITADKYDADRHFFLSQYFRDKYDEALSDLPIIRSNINIRKIEVWVTNRSGKFENSRNIVAFMDLGENEEHFYAEDPVFSTSTLKIPANQTNNLYELITTQLVGIRDVSNVTNLLSRIQDFNSGIDYEKVQNARLLSSSEYYFNASLGYISLNSQLNNDEVLAVAFEYENTTTGETYRVGEFSNEGPAAPDALFLKLIKPTILSTEYPTWDLMMKNVYAFNAYQVNSQDFKMDVMYRNDRTGSSVNYIPAGNIEGEILLRVLGLDNLNKNNQPGVDGYFDFIDKVTINASNGKIFFPVIEPFGSYLKQKITEGNENDPEINRIAEQYIFQELYDETQNSAEQKAEKNKFFLKGEYRSAGGSEINLNAMNIPEGSVTVTAGAEILTENQDYTVDYNLGRVTILNEGILESGTPIKISLESNSMYDVGNKSMIGTHLDYRISDNFNVGATIMHLHQKPQTVKVSIGNEAISNTIWGTDINYNKELPILTRFVDKIIPFIKTKAPSNIDFSGEFAQLIPGHPRILGEEGFAHIDDFEGSKITFDLKSPGRWRIAATPQGQPDMFPEAGSINSLSYGYNRAKLAWYNINRDLLARNAIDYLSIEDLADHRVREILEQEIFPDRDYETGIPTSIYVLNLAFYPQEKGPYNYDVNPVPGISAGINSGGYLENPKSRWAGISQSLTSNNFEEQNIEFVEFWILDPFIYSPNHSGGDIYLNFGSISEDILRDSRQSFENGLPTSAGVLGVTDETIWGKVPVLPRITNDFAVEPADARQHQDVGLDGLSDSDENTFFDNYLNTLSTVISDGNILNKIKEDPSGDNYMFFKDPQYDEERAGILDRYKKYNNQEQNSSSTNTGNNTVSSSPILTPDMEDLNNDYTLSETEAYFQYKIHLEPSEMIVGKNYITDIREAEVDPDKDNIKEIVKWYHLKIPLDDYQKKIGAIQDFKSIRFLRLFMKDWDEEIVLRIAEMDLVRGDWRKYRLSMLEGTEGTGTPEFTDAQLEINVVNIEENSFREPVNYVLPPNVSREISPGNTYLTQLNEQAISLKVNNLSDGDARAAYKNASLDVRQFKRLQMFIHAEAVADNILNDDDLCVFIRLGSDYKDNYYEYEIPLKLTEPGYYNNGTIDEPDRELVWPLDNMLDVDFEVFQTIKQERNIKNSLNLIDLTSEYSRYDVENYGEETGRRVSIAGTPNLSNIRTIMLGIRNKNKDKNKLLDDGLSKSTEVWLNELRLSGFNEQGGWATRGRLQTNLADFSTIALAGEYSTPGFGSIEKRVNERQKSTDKSYDFSIGAEMGKFFPKKYGVKVPVYIGYSESFSDPEYDPINPDIKMTTVLKSMTQEERNAHLQITQDYLKRKSFNVTNFKINGNSEKKTDSEKKSKSSKTKNKPLWHISNWTAGYGINETYIRNINTDHNLLKVQTGILAYNYNISPKNITPFSKIKFLNKKVFKIIKDFNFYYAPSMIAFRTDMRKSYNEVQLRNIESIKAGNYSDTLTSNFDKQFTWNRTYDVKYSLTKDLKFSYTANNQSWVDEPDGKIDKNDNYLWTNYKDSVVGNIKDFGRTTDFHQNINAVWNLPINKLPLLGWTNINARYDADYYWTEGLKSAENEKLGNTIRNNQSVQLSAQLNFETIYKKVKFLKTVDEKFNGRNKKTEKKYKTVNYVKENLKLKKDKSKTIIHNLKTEDVSVTVSDKNKKTIKGQTEIIDAGKIKFTPEEDVENALIEISGKREIKDNIFREIADYTLYALMSVRNVSLNYTEKNGMVVPGYLPKTKFFGYNDTWEAPGWKFITGFPDSSFMRTAADKLWISGDSLLNTPTVTTHDVNLNLRASLKPIQGMHIDLNADRRENLSKNEYWVKTEYGFEDNREKYETGNFSISFLSIKTAFKQNKLDSLYNSNAYEEFKRNRFIVAKILADERASLIPSYNPNEPNLVVDTTGMISVRDSFPFGYSDVSQDVLLPAFLAAYSGQSISKTSKFPKIPMPNWRIKYDGLSDYEFIKKYIKKITINHGYTSLYNVSQYNTNTNFEEYENTGLSEVTDELNHNFISDYQLGGVSIDEKFIPLIGVDMRWNNEMQTKVEYKQTRLLLLSFSNNQILETLNKEYVVGFGYKITDLKIPMMIQGTQKLFQSDLNIRFDFTYRDMYSIIRRINEEANNLSAGNKNVSLKINADYNLDKVTLRVFYERILNEPHVSNSFRTTNTHIGFSLRFNLANI